METRVALGLELLAKNCSKIEGRVANLKVCDLQLETNVAGFSY